MKQCARKAYRTTSRKELSRWGTHSIRVGARVALSEEGKDTPFIKIRLRWNSVAFKDYLRNTITLTQHHNEAFNKVSIVGKE